MSQFAIVCVFAEIADNNAVSIATDIRTDDDSVYRLHWDPVAGSAELALRAQPHKVGESAALEPADMLSLIRELGDWADKPDQFILDEVKRYAQAPGNEAEARPCVSGDHQTALYHYACECPGISRARREAMQYAVQYCTPLVAREEVTAALATSAV